MRLDEIEARYNLELDKIVSKVNKEKVKKVLIQLPDGLKPAATEIVDYLEEATKQQGVEFGIWAGSCFGACDVPETDADLVVQFGHAEW